MLSWLTGSPARKGSTGLSDKESDKYSLVQLQKLYTLLSENQNLPTGSHEVVIESIRCVAEIVIYGDQHTENFFDYFCEKNMLTLFLGLLGQPHCSSKIKVQIIQTVSIIVQNIRNEMSLYYVLSNNHVNQLIKHPFNFQDEELLAFYISFLKTLSLKLNNKTIQFFFNDRLNSLPLYEEAIKFYDHQEGMIRTAVRAITLNVFRVGDENMHSFLTRGPSARYFEDIIRFLHHECRKLHLSILSFSSVHLSSHTSNEFREKATRSNLLKLEIGLTEQQDHLIYLQDIFNIDSDEIESVVVDSAMAYLYWPLIIAGLLPTVQPFGELDDINDAEVGLLGIDKNYLRECDMTSAGSLLSLFLLANTYFAISNTRFLRRLTETIFLPKIPSGVSTSGKDKPVRKSHSSAKLDAEDARDRVFSSCMTPVNEIYAEAVPGNLNEDIDFEFQRTTVVENDPNENIPVLEYADDDKSLLQPLHDSISIVDGVQLTPDSTNEEVNLGQPYTEAGLDTNDSKMSSNDDNPIRAAFFNLLVHDDERHVLGAVCVLYALINNKGVEKDLLDECELSPANQRTARRLLHKLTSPESIPPMQNNVNQNEEESAHSGTVEGGNNKRKKMGPVLNTMAPTIPIHADISPRVKTDFDPLRSELNLGDESSIEQNKGEKLQITTNVNHSDVNADDNEQDLIGTENLDAAQANIDAAQANIPLPSKELVVAPDSEELDIEIVSDSHVDLDPVSPLVLTSASMITKVVENDNVTDDCGYDYPTEVVTKLLSILRRDPPVRPITQRIIAKLLIDLCFEERRKIPCLHPEHMATLRLAYNKAVDRVMTLLKVIDQDVFFEIFQEEWRKLREGPLVVESKMTNPALLIPLYQLNGGTLKKGMSWSGLTDLVSLEARSPQTPLEDAQTAIRSVMIIRLLWCTLYQQGSSKLNSICTTKLEIAENRRIDVEKCEYVKVKVLGVPEANNRNKMIVKDAFMVLAHGSLILVDPETPSSSRASPIPGKGVTKSVSPLHRIQVGVDHLDPRQLHICVRSHSPIGWARKQNTLPSSAKALLKSNTSNGSGYQQKPYKSDLKIPCWYITLMFCDHATSNWAREDLERAIKLTLTEKICGIKKVLLDTLDTTEKS